MADWIVLAVLAAILGGAGFFVYRAKKSGKPCIGCPDGCACHCQKSRGQHRCHCGKA